jgi:hypothetical protein
MKIKTISLFLLFCLFIAGKSSAQNFCNCTVAYKMGQGDAQNYHEKKLIGMGLRCKKDTAYTHIEFERDYNKGYDDKMAELAGKPKDTVNFHPTCSISELTYTPNANLFSNFQVDDKDGIKEIVAVSIPECMTFKLDRITSSAMSLNFKDMTKNTSDRAVIQINSAKMININGKDIILKVTDFKGNVEEVRIKLVAH